MLTLTMRFPHLLYPGLLSRLKFVGVNVEGAIHGLWASFSSGPTQDAVHSQA